MTFSATGQSDFVEKTDNGYFISNENMVELANYIEELKAERNKWKAKANELNKALEEERKFVDELLKKNQELYEAQQEQIELLNEMLKQSKPSIFDKANKMLGGAGIASVIIALAMIQ